jgi:hypothetical protein
LDLEELKMNDNRRGRTKQAQAFLMQAKELVDAVTEEEQESLDNLPENLRGEQGSKMEEYIGYLEEASNGIDNADSILSEIA